MGIRTTSPGAYRRVKGVSVRSTRRWTHSHRKAAPALRTRAPGSRPASRRTWNPLQIPSTSPPAAANRRTARSTGLVAATAPGRR